MSRSGGTPFNQQLYEEAAAWLVDLRADDIDVSAQVGFSRWLRTSPEHVRAYLELAAVWNQAGELDRAHFTPDLELLEQCRQQTNVIPLAASLPERSHEANGALPRVLERWRTGVAKRNLLGVAAALLLAAAGAFEWYWQEVQAVYATGIGEQHVITLSDGSAIELNANSRVRVKYDSHARQVELLRGQALFNIAPNVSRPFLVKTADAQVRAIGTRFDVYLKAANTTITVIQGTVGVLPITPRPNEKSAPPVRPDGPASGGVRSSSAVAGAGRGYEPPASHEKVSPSGPGAGEMLLTAGEQALVEGAAAIKQASPDIVAATAWTQGHIVFHGTLLKDVATEFNRYNTRQLVIRDPELFTFKVTGIFSCSDPMSLIRFLEARPEMNVTETADAIIISKKRVSPAATYESDRRAESNLRDGARA